MWLSRVSPKAAGGVASAARWRSSLRPREQRHGLGGIGREVEEPSVIAERPTELERVGVCAVEGECALRLSEPERGPPAIVRPAEGPDQVELLEGQPAPGDYGTHPVGLTACACSNRESARRSRPAAPAVSPVARSGSTSRDSFSACWKRCQARGSWASERTRSSESYLLAQAAAQEHRDLGGEVGLERQDLMLGALDPGVVDLGAARGVDQRDAELDAIAERVHGAMDQGADPECAPDALRRHGDVPVGSDAVPRDHVERWTSAELVNQPSVMPSARYSRESARGRWSK